MPIRSRRNKRRYSAQITPEAVALFREGLRERDEYKLKDIRIDLAAALGRSKFSACPLDSKPRSLIGCDREPTDVVLGLRAQLLKEIRDHQ
ncbi:hypothetical protein ABIF63_006137 [Bradyrhizobium japonicum]|uniref:Uncharacterized protein n=1 Tax=Bradyrhizobium japonicum TaxID=375 RepID=A0ABV2RYP2_BRAJP